MSSSNGYAKLLQKLLSEFIELRNGVRMHKDNEKEGPSVLIVILPGTYSVL